MKTKLIAAALILASAFGAANAQGRGALKINEVMVVNDQNLVDEYGNRSAWIELFNSGYAPLEISKVYLTNDSTNPTMYAVPLGDVKTRIPKREHVIFWADNHPTRGTFHTNFTLTPGQDNYIAIYDADGKTLIDEVVIPASLQPGMSMARIPDGTGRWLTRDDSDAQHISPSAVNVIREGNEKAAKFAEMDANGFGMAIIAMCIVFSALLLLSICFYIISRIGAAAQGRRKEQALGTTGEAKATGTKPSHDSGEEIAAIVMALHEHLNVHDRESTILTLNKVKKAYSPWNSKIYNLRVMPSPHKR